MGQTVKSVDDKLDKHFDEQQLLEKMQQQKTIVNCPKCQSRPELRMTEEQLTKLRIEYVKNQILKKLQMTERPNVSATNLPRPVAEGSMIDPVDEEEQQNNAFEQFYGKTTQKIIFLELGTYQLANYKFIIFFPSFFLVIVKFIDMFPSCRTISWMNLTHSFMFYAVFECFIIQFIQCV